jgi:dihydroorotate dehydrogenase (fumarate)
MTDATVNLSTRYLGLELPTPIVVGSCGLTGTVDGVRACARAGAGAVVLKSVFEEQIAAEVNQLHAASTQPYDHPEAHQYIAAYGTHNAIGEYLRLIEDARKAVSIPVIPSIHCATATGWSTFARKAEAAGADALELNAFVLPAAASHTGASVEQFYFDALSEVKRQVGIPVALKIGYFFSSLPEMAAKLYARGADGLVLFNRFYPTDLDIETFAIIHGPAFSVPEETHLTMRAVAQLAGKVQCDLAATTGIHDGATVVKQLLVGATVVQVASVLYKHRVEYLETMVAELRAWMVRKNFERLDAFRGKMKQQSWPDGAAYDRVQFMKRTLAGEKI